MAILPRFQRELLTWLDEVRPRLPAYVRLTNRTKSYVALALHPSRDIEAIVKDYEIDVAVTLPGTDQCWDLIYSELTPANRERDGTYVSGWPGRESDRYSSRRAFWRGALFEPFLEWLTTCFAVADRVELYELQPSGATWARLASGPDYAEPDLKPVCHIPIDWP